VKLAKAMRDGRKILYMDESRFDNWALQRRAWSAKGRNAFVVKNQKMWSTTVYGVIGQIKRPAFHYCKGCDSNNLMEFIPKIRDAC
jgi:hypothetical protein